ncbi:Trimethylguanosine synthase [Schistosoma japonicum]|nr:Trimethylguanosine synthase [Schistosoma japonicum]
MRHVRLLSQWQFYPDSGVDIPVNFFFTRAFLGDHFKGFRTRNELSKKQQDSINTYNSKCVSSSSLEKKLSQHKECNRIETVSTNVCKHIVFSDSEECEDKQKCAIVPEEIKHQTVYHTNSRKYFTSVSYTLKHLRHSDPSKSESESSSSDSNHELRAQNLPTVSSHETRSIASSDCCFDGSEITNDIVNNDVVELCTMLNEMRQLGLPTSFGCLHKQESVNPTFPKCQNSLLQRKEGNMRKCLSELDIKSQYSLSSISSSGELKGLVDPYFCAESVFSRLCYVLEMACIFIDNSYRALGEWKLSLPRCWDSPTFNLDALLYNCRYFWRYNPPMPKISSGSSQMICAESNPAIDKYWAQRFRLFSRFDSGIQVDCNSLFSATPEVIAAHQAKRIYRIFSPAPQKKINHTVLDIFCGTGSNAIQFALRGFRVIAIESDPIRISMAAHNSEIYGVRHLIEFVCEDYFSWAWKQVHSRIISQSDLSENTMYVAALMSPPWGGPSYLEQESFNLSGIQFQNSNANLWCALYLALVLTNGNVALFLPRNTNVADFLEISVKCIKEIKMKSLDIEFELDLINFKSKALTVYFGALANANIRIAANVEINLSEESDYCN